MADMIFDTEIYRGVDYYSSDQTTSTNLTCLKSKGFDDFVCRYYSSSVVDKNLTKEEAETISNAGFYIVPVFQNRQNQIADFDYSQGFERGRSAAGKADIVGQPYNSAIYFAVDFDVQTTEEIDAVKDFFRGVNATFNEYANYNNGNKWLIGVYGSYTTVKELDGYYGVTKTWQTSSWSENNYSARNLYQYEHNLSNFCNIDPNIDKNASDGSHGGFRL